MGFHASGGRLGTCITGLSLLPGSSMPLLLPLSLHAYGSSNGFEKTSGLRVLAACLSPHLWTKGSEGVTGCSFLSSDGGSMSWLDLELHLSG
jgi:hypothetical protein